jgi:hypothetical protein
VRSRGGLNRRVGVDEGQMIETNLERLTRRFSRDAHVHPGLSGKRMTCGTPCQ